jgi:hypothetical protein
LQIQSQRSSALPSHHFWREEDSVSRMIGILPIFRYNKNTTFMQKLNFKIERNQLGLWAKSDKQLIYFFADKVQDTCGFRSRWIRLLSRRTCRPAAVTESSPLLTEKTEKEKTTINNWNIPSWSIKCLAVASGTLPCRWMYKERSPPLQYSNTRCIFPGAYIKLMQFLSRDFLDAPINVNFIYLYT